MYCNKCGSEIIPGAKFCMNCGESIGINLAKNKVYAEGESQAHCKKCGVGINPGAKYCINCGASIGINLVKNEVFAGGKDNNPLDGLQDEKVENTGSKRGFSKGIIALIITGIILVAVIGLLTVTQNNDSGLNDDDFVSTTNEASGSYDSIDSSAQFEDDAKEKDYSAVKSDISWSDAKSSAENSGGSLACIHDADEMEKICECAEQNNISVLWVGANRLSDQDWSDAKWLDGTSFSNYQKWFSGEPSYFDAKSGVEETCLMIFKVNGEWYYNDAPDNALQYAANYSGKMGYAIEK